MLLRLFTLAFYALSASSVLFASQTYKSQGLDFVLPVAVNPATNKLSLLLIHSKDHPYWIPFETGASNSEERSKFLSLQTNFNYSSVPEMNPSFTIDKGPLSGVGFFVVPVEYKDPQLLFKSPQVVEKQLNSTDLDLYKRITAELDGYAWFPLDTLQTKMTIPSIPVSSQGGRLALIQPQIYAVLKSYISQIKQGATQTSAGKQLPVKQGFKVGGPVQQAPRNQDGPSIDPREMFKALQGKSPKEAIDWLFQKTSNPAKVEFLAVLGILLGAKDPFEGLTLIDEARSNNDSNVKDLLLELIALRAEGRGAYGTLSDRNPDNYDVYYLLNFWENGGVEPSQTLSSTTSL